MQGRRGWHQIEDDRLLKIIKKYGVKNWTLIAEKLSLGTTYERTGKQCRQRWHNHLNPDISNKEWLKTEDELLFEAHRKYGSKWKQISKLFAGRTDNSIKNHFYSTVRRCLRKVGKLKGEKQISITMKSIKPSVLSRIVENTELTNLIVTIGRDKSRNFQSDKLGLDETALNQIISELVKISQQNQKINNDQELSLKNANFESNKSESPLSSSSKLQEQQAKASIQGTLKLPPQSESLKCYFEEQIGHQSRDREDLILETQQQSKERHQPIIPHFMHELDAKAKYQTADKQAEIQNDEQYWIEQESHDFFVSPSCGRRQLFPQMKLLQKISKNSQSPGSLGYGERNPIQTKQPLKQQQDIQIDFDAHDFLNRSYDQPSQNNDC